MRVLVVGASRGIGAAIAAACAAGGDRVVGASRSATAPGGCLPVTLDVADPESVRRGVAEAGEQLGGLDAVVYCPAVLPLAPLAETPDEVWADVWRTNVVGAQLVTVAVLPALRESAGRALYLSSDAVGNPRSGLAAYAVSKAALDQLVECWRIEEPGVGFTRVTCGPTLTTIAGSWDLELAQRYFAEWQAAGKTELLGGVLTPEQVADRVVDVLSGPVVSAIEVVPGS